MSDTNSLDSPRSNYFKEITTPLKNLASVQKLPHRDGVGMIADADIKEASLLWEEKPIYGVCARDIPEEDHVDFCCDLCGRYCGTLILQLKLLLCQVSRREACEVFHSGDAAQVKELLESFEVLPGFARLQDSILSEGTPLVRKIGPDESEGSGYFAFCSPVCAEGWDALVGEELSKTSEFLEFYRFVQKEKIGALYLMFLCVVAGNVQVKKHAGLNGLNALCGDVYWKTTDPDDDETLQEHIEACEDLCAKSALSLCKLQKKFPEKFGQQEITPQTVSHIMGRLCRNMIQMSFSSPIFEYLASLRSLSDSALNSPEMQRLGELLKDLPEVETSEAFDGELDLDVGGFMLRAEQIPSFQGWAVFPILSTVNHECEPNLDADFIQGDFTVTVTANRDIKKGEELFISYLDTVEADVDSRKEMLNSYGFTCNCKKCKSESAPKSAGFPKAKKARTG